MKRVILLLFMSLSLLSAQEVTKEQVNQIFQIQDDDARLAPFDQWAKFMGFIRKEMESLGNRSVEVDSDPMDDSNKIFFPALLGKAGVLMVFQPLLFAGRTGNLTVISTGTITWLIIIR